MLAAAALEIVLEPGLDIRESARIVWTMSEDPRRGHLAYEFMKRNFDALVARMPRDAAAEFPHWGRQFCDEAGRADMAAFFRDRIGRIEGGPRILAQTEEAIGLCAAFKNRQRPSLTQFLRPWSK